MSDPGLIAEGAELRLLGSGYAFTEGPAVDRQGNIFFTDQPNDRIYRWDHATDEITVFLDHTGRSNGTYFDRDGHLIAAADMYGQLWRIAPDGSHEVIVDGHQGSPLNGPNDVWVAPNGGIYFTDPLFVRGYWDDDDPRRDGTQQGGEFVYYLAPDGQTLTRIAEVEGTRPNGVVGTPDGRTLYVAQMQPVGRILAYDINPDGSLSNRRAFADHPAPDGMTIDSVGNIYVAGGSSEGHESSVTIFDPQGQPVLEIPTGQGWTANVAFGGPERKTLFITAGDSVFGIEMRVSGVR